MGMIGKRAKLTSRDYRTRQSVKTIIFAYGMALGKCANDLVET